MSSSSSTFRIADTFTDSLAKLTGDEQKAVKTTAFDLQLNPANPGMSFHKLDKAKDKNFWSVRVNKDIRLIVHKMPGSLMLCYVDHHDKAYDWAERRKLEVHPATGAAQLVEIRETVLEIVIPMHVAKEQPAVAKPALFRELSDETLLGYGVPSEWIGDVRAATEDSIFDVADRLPREAAEALLDLATGSVPAATVAAAQPPTDPFEHPDAQRRFRVITNVEELTQALEYPWDKWSVFLHPAQRSIVERRFNGPARVSGSAGTGKTVVALHRAVFLAESDPDSRILLTTFSATLANALRIKLRRLIAAKPRLGERIDVEAMDDAALRLYERNIGKVKLATRDEIHAALKAGREAAGIDNFGLPFVHSEWEQVVDQWQLRTWDAYRSVSRLGRRTRLPEKQRERLWAAFEHVHASLSQRRVMTMAQVYAGLAAHLATTAMRPYDFIVVDEAQDVSVPQLRFLAAIGNARPSALFFAGDLGQRIFQTPFSWRELGVDIRGRSSTLRINYRTSHQIRAQADRLLDKEIADVDGNQERRSAISVFNGPRPGIATFESPDQEIDAVSSWLKACVSEGVSPTEIGVFVRSPAEFPRAESALRAAGVPFRRLDDRVETVSGTASVGSMHLAKGLEFRAVAVMACDDEVLPLQTRIEGAGDDAELEEVYATERNLLYVACTRARDRLMVSGVKPASEFLDDLTAARRR